MPIYTDGWIEYSLYDNEEERSEENAWLSWMDISTIIKHIDEVHWVLIGDPRKFKSDQTRFKSIAKDRGFPNNPSYYLKLDIELINNSQNNDSVGEYFGFTYLSYSEIENINWKDDYQLEIENSDWGNLFELIDKFRDLKRLNSEQIRLVIWYNW